MTIKEYNTGFYKKYTKAVGFISNLNHTIDKCCANTKSQMECIGYDEDTVKFILNALEEYDKSVKENLSIGVCSCYNVEYDTRFCEALGRSITTQVCRCNGTRERDVCDCGGDKTRCTFYGH